MAVVVLAVGGAAASSALASFPGRNGRIVYVWWGESAYRAGPMETSIRVVDPRSGRVRVLRNCPLLPLRYTECAVGAPRYSPDGRGIAFPTTRIVRDFTGQQPTQYLPGLGTMASDGTGFEEHAIENGYGALAWSPAGNRLLVQREGLFLASLDGAELSRVMPGTTGPPDWSSTGQIAFSDFPSRSCFPACIDIYLTRLGGTPRRLTFRGGYSPSWSPHGTKLAFVRATHGPGVDDREIYIVRRDGLGLHRFTRRSGSGPSWSPDGKWIAFIRHGSLYLARSTGGHLRRVVKGFADALGEGEQVMSIDWQPLPPG